MFLSLAVFSLLLFYANAVVLKPIRPDESTSGSARLRRRGEVSNLDLRNEETLLWGQDGTIPFDCHIHSHTNRHRRRSRQFHRLHARGFGEHSQHGALQQHVDFNLLHQEQHNTCFCGRHDVRLCTASLGLGQRRRRPLFCHGSWRPRLRLEPRPSTIHRIDDQI